MNHVLRVRPYVLLVLRVLRNAFHANGNGLIRCATYNDPLKGAPPTAGVFLCACFHDLEACLAADSRGPLMQDCVDSCDAPTKLADLGRVGESFSARLDAQAEELFFDPFQVKIKFRVGLAADVFDVHRNVSNVLSVSALSDWPHGGPS